MGITGILKELDGLLINVSELHQQRAQAIPAFALKSGKWNHRAAHQQQQGMRRCDESRPSRLILQQRVPLKSAVNRSTDPRHPSAIYLPVSCPFNRPAIEGMEIEDAVTASLKN